MVVDKDEPTQEEIDPTIVNEPTKEEVAPTRKGIKNGEFSSICP